MQNNSFLTAGEQADSLTSESDHKALPVITVRGLTKVYHAGQNHVRALRGVALEIQKGDFVAIMGPSGSGKSTFLNIIGCLDHPTGGDYWLAGIHVSQLSSDRLAEIRNRRIGFVFQDFNLLPRATALKNVMLPLMYAGLPQRVQAYTARRVLYMLGLKDRIHHTPSQLSGGQQQRVVIARALVSNPALLLADEPTGNLDSRTGVEIMATLQALNDLGLTIVLVTHDANIAAYARRRIMFHDGQIVRDEPVTDGHNAPALWSGSIQSQNEDNSEESKGDML